MNVDAGFDSKSLKETVIKTNRTKCKRQSGWLQKHITHNPIFHDMLFD